MGCCTIFIPKIEIKKNHVFLHEYNQSRLYCQLNVCDHNFPLEVKIINDFYYMTTASSLYIGEFIHVQR
jgi:hypothetical protein